MYSVECFFLNDPATSETYPLSLPDAFPILFVGPAKSSTRTFLARLSPPGREGEMFGLYATTGRAVSFLAPTLVGLFTYGFGKDRAGIAGILVVLAAGLAAPLPVRAPAAELRRGEKGGALGGERGRKGKS